MRRRDQPNSVAGMKHRILALNGHDTRVYTSGETGPACLFLHGFPEHGGAWSGIMERLNGFRCFAPDQRGYGISYKPDDVGDYVTGKIARDVLGLIDVLELDRVHIICFCHDMLSLANETSGVAE